MTGICFFLLLLTERDLDPSDTKNTKSINSFSEEMMKAIILNRKKLKPLSP